MRSITQVLLLLIYLLLVFVVSRMLDLVLWYQHGISSTQAVDPLALSVRQLKYLLQNRGVSYAGFVEKQELVQLVEASGDLLQGEVNDLKDGDDKDSAQVPASHFSGQSQFLEEVEDNKDSIWLVQVVPAGKHDAQTPYDDSWRSVCAKVAPFQIRTGIFECQLNRKYCLGKGWNQPMLLLALPKGSRVNDEVVLGKFAFTKPQMIVDWVQNELSTYVKTVTDLDEVENDWLRQSSLSDNSTRTSSSFKDVRVLLLSHLFSPPLFLAALSIKFSGRITFGIFSVNKEDSEVVRKRLKLADSKVPVYVVITPERTVIYGRRRFEHFNFKSMNQFLRAVQPEMNDVFLCTLVLVNMLVSLQIFQVSVRLWWKHVARCLWTVVSYNFWLFASWLLFLATYRFSFITFLADKCLVPVRCISLTEIGAMLRADWLSLSQHPYLLFLTFFLYGWAATWLLKRYYATDLHRDGETELPWWEVLPVDSIWINCFFRPMGSLPRPLLTSEVELEEGIDMLIERLAVPNLWLQPVIATEYIKNLPVWRHRGWDLTMPKSDAQRAVKLLATEQETIERIMDGEDPTKIICQGCLAERAVHRPPTRSSPCSRKNRLASVSKSTLLETTSPDGSSSSATVGRRMSIDSATFRYNREISHSANSSPDSGQSELGLLCSSCESERLSDHRDDEPVLKSGAHDPTTSCGSTRECTSEESGDESCAVPQGMRPTSECAVCLESYSWQTQLCGLPCGHSYHHSCIMAWLKLDNHHCPVCRWPAYKNKLAQSHLHCE